jgi:hypothetical protein
MHRRNGSAETAKCGGSRSQWRAGTEIAQSASVRAQSAARRANVRDSRNWSRNSCYMGSAYRIL